METQTETRAPRKIGRPFKRVSAPLRTISLTLPPGDIARMEQEGPGVGAPSISGFVRIAVGDYLMRLEKRRNRREVD